MIDHYPGPLGREALWRFGPDTGPTVIVAPPLFEEANRTRTFIVDLLRRLADRGIAGALPDLPGQGESVTPTASVRLAHWRKGFAAAAAMLGQPFTVAIRGGALVAGEATRSGAWVFAPVNGSALVRDFQRARAVSDPGQPSLIDLANSAEPGAQTLTAGIDLSVDLIRDLIEATPDLPEGHRLVRLEQDRAEAAARYPGAALWRRSEPGEDPVLAELLAGDIADWVQSCAG